VLCRRVFHQVQGRADSQSIAVAAGGVVVEDHLVFVDFAVVTEQAENREIPVGAERVHLDGNLAACQAFGDDEGLGGNDFLPVHLRARCIQQDVDRQVSDLIGGILQEHLIVVEVDVSPDLTCNQTASFGPALRIFKVGEQGGAQHVGEFFNADAVPGNVILVVSLVPLSLTERFPAGGCWANFCQRVCVEFAAGEVQVTALVVVGA